MMKEQIKTITKKTLPLVVLLVFITGRVRAQQAPTYNNNFLMGDDTYTYFSLDRLEYYHVNGGLIRLDAQGYIKKKLHKFWFEAEGEALTARTEGEISLEALYGHVISPYFDIRAGIRYDMAYHATDTRGRAFAVVGIQGLAPYLFEVEANLLVSQAGDVSVEAEAEYDFPVTQRLWGEMSVGTSVAVQEVPEWNVGSGSNNVELGFRLRYQIKREFAPYIGISWYRALGETADFIRADGGETSTFGLVGGVRMWF